MKPVIANHRRARTFRSRTPIVYETGREVKDLGTVFIVDDDLMALESLAKVLRDHGYSVQCFASAASFMAQHASRKVGCVLVNLVASGMPGSELIHWLQARPNLLSIINILDTLGSPLPVHHGEKTPSSCPSGEMTALMTVIDRGLADSERRRLILEHDERINQYFKDQSN
jgi:CheY-like chemotaxis protein